MSEERKDIFQPIAPEVRQKLAHGVSRGTAIIIFLKPQWGDRNHREPDVESSAPPGLVRLSNPPTAHAVGYLRPLLRSSSAVEYTCRTSPTFNPKFRS